MVDLEICNAISRCADVIREGRSQEVVATLGPVVTRQLQQQPFVKVVVFHRLYAIEWMRCAAGARVTGLVVLTVVSVRDKDGLVGGAGYCDGVRLAAKRIRYTLHRKVDMILILGFATADISSVFVPTCTSGNLSIPVSNSNPPNC